MIRKRKYSKPFDLCHSILFNEYPLEYTREIGVPGEFEKKINRRVHLKNGAGGEMDSAYLNKPDDIILFEKVATDLEHQSSYINDEKLNKIGDYDTQLVVDEHLPTLIVIASHLEKEKSKDMLIRSPSDITKLYFLDLGEENIRQRLYTVSQIINNNQHLSTENALNLGIIILYAPREEAWEITETVVNLYQKIAKNLDFKMETCLYQVITIMIDAYFDDEKEYRRLINMVEKNTSEKTIEITAAHQNTIESLKYAQEDLEYTKTDLKNTKANLKNKETDLKNTKTDLEKTQKKLAKANGKIMTLEKEVSEIPKLKAEIQRLTAQINGK
ncbi:coiled-coil domain-containing protein [Methanobrevibacter sp.]|uniref:coiled-coil domain-containing protein n=1 Tax=Methanobrevibacter sp. TaxID=66852 RepID=UPI00388EE8F3